MDPQIEIDRLRAEVERLGRHLSVAQAEVQHFRRKDQLQELAAGGASFDLVEELREAEAMTEEQWARHVERITTHYARA